MNSTVKSRILASPKRKCLVLSLFIFIHSTCFSMPAYAEIWVVIHAEQSAQLTTNTIRSIFSLRQKHWPDGQMIELVVMDNNTPLHKQFCLDALHLFPYQLSRIWERQIYTGTAVTPTVVNSEQAILDIIKNNPYAIGYASQEVNDEALHSFVVK